MKLAGYTDYESFCKSHREWVAAEIEKVEYRRKAYWTESIAVGGKEFVKEIKNRLSNRASGRKMRPLRHGMELRETIASYNAFFGPQNDDIGSKYSPF